MTKDRLTEIKKALSNGQNKSSNNIEVESETTNKNKNLKKTFERAEVLGQWIQTIEDNSETIKQYLRNNDDIKLNKKDIRDKLDSLFQNNTTISHQITAKLKEFKAELQDSDNESAESRIKNIQFNAIKTRYQHAFQNNTRHLENYKTMQKDIIRAHLTAKGNIHVTDEELTSLIDEGRDIQVFTENILSETAETRRMLADIEERHEQLMKIERMLTEVRDLFVQMAILVDTQQELVDRVEYLAQSAQDYICSGTGDLENANKSKTKHRKRKIYLLIGLTILIVIILVLIFVR